MEIPDRASPESVDKAIVFLLGPVGALLLARSTAVAAEDVAAAGGRCAALPRVHQRAVVAGALHVLMDGTWMTGFLIELPCSVQTLISPSSIPRGNI